MNKQLLKKKCCDRLRQHVATSCCCHKIIISGKKIKIGKRYFTLFRESLPLMGLLFQRTDLKKLYQKLFQGTSV